MVDIDKIVKFYIVDHYAIDIVDCNIKNIDYLFPYGFYYKIDEVNIGKNIYDLYIKPTDDQNIEFYIRDLNIKFEVYYNCVFDSDEDYTIFLSNYQTILKETKL